MRRGLRIPLFVVAALALAAALLAPSAALGHATPEGSTPPRGAVVERQPEAVTFRFSEPVEGNFGSVRVYDAAGERVEEGEAFHPDGAGSELAVALRPDLPDGSYTATYRVVSADGHIVAGGYVFSIGSPGQAPQETVAELVEGGDASTAAEIGLGAARGLQYAALAAALGALVFSLLVWGEGRAFSRRLRRLLLVAGFVGFFSALAAIVFHAAEAAGVGVGAALDTTILREEIGTRFGVVWWLAAMAWALFCLAVSTALRAPASWRAALLLPTLTLVALEPALSGHAGTQSPQILLVAANFVHVLAMSVWLGGLATFVLVLPAATRELEPPERSRVLATALARFSPIALLCVAAILLTGLGQAYAFVRELDALFDTAYGRAVLIKLVLLVGLLIPFGAYNRYRSAPALRRIAAGGEAPGRAGVVLRRALRSEVGLLVVVLGVTAALAAYQPPVGEQAGPFSDSAALGPAQMELTVDPARVGYNQIHLYLFEADSGAPLRGIRELDLSATLPSKSIGPLPLEVQRSGPGHYTVPGAQLGVAGEWELDFALRLSAFDQFETQVDVPIE